MSRVGCLLSENSWVIDRLCAARVSATFKTTYPDNLAAPTERGYKNRPVSPLLYVPATSGLLTSKQVFRNPRHVPYTMKEISTRRARIRSSVVNGDRLTRSSCLGRRPQVSGSLRLVSRERPAEFLPTHSHLLRTCSGPRRILHKALFPISSSLTDLRCTPLLSFNESSRQSNLSDPNAGPFPP